MFPSLYTLIVYVTSSFLFTSIGFFACLYSAVVSLSFTSGFIFASGSLVYVPSNSFSSTLFIFVVNFLNAKSKFCGI